MVKRYSVHEIRDAISDLSDTQESDVSDSCSEYLPEQLEPEDFDFDDSEVSSDNEPEDLANEDNDTERFTRNCTGIIKSHTLISVWNYQKH